MPVTVVTDSTAYLPVGFADERRIWTVPLQVRLGERAGLEGVQVGTAELTIALADKRLDVQTSRPSPADFAACYQQALVEGADTVVSVHLSSELSGTWEAARMAAEQVDPRRIRVVDSRAAAMGLGFAVIAAADAAASGQSGRAVEYAATAAAERCRVFFCVDSLDRLRRGGRIGTAAAFLGTALSVKPLLHVQEGRIVPLEKVRTMARAVQRLVDQAVAAAGDGPVDIAVHHLAAPARADQLASMLQERLTVSRMLVSELGAVIGAHVGLGAVGVVVVPKSV